MLLNFPVNNIDLVKDNEQKGIVVIEKIDKIKLLKLNIDYKRLQGPLKGYGNLKYLMKR
jgi:hypothetical protein